MISKKERKKFFDLFHSLEISWQVYSIIIVYLVIMCAAFILRWEIGLMLLVLLLIIISYGIYRGQRIIKNFNTIANRISQSAQVAQEDSLYRAPIAILMYDDDNQIRWVNPQMQQIFGNKDLLGEEMLSVDPEFNKIIKVKTDKNWHRVKFKQRVYRVLHQEYMQSYYLFDITEEDTIRQERKHDQLVYGYLYLDDYDEVIASMNDEQSTNFDAELIKDLNTWYKEFNIYSKRLDNEKFLLLFNKRSLDKLEESKFKYLDELRERNHLKNVPITLSLGIAYPETSTYEIPELADQAQLNLDLALGRGGDQIVVRSSTGKARFYGGKTNPIQRRTTVRSRLVYQALVTTMKRADQVIIAGHKVPDTDAIGAAIGIYKIAQQQKVKAKIVINPEELNNDIKELLSITQFRENRDAMFIDTKVVDEIMTDETVIVLVDHSKPSISEAESILDGHDVIIIDHHRRGEEFPKQTVLTYIEPYASSTSELVTEFFMNQRYTDEALNKDEATALLSGIIVDTNYFSARTGSRTFDAASYLKSREANTTEIQRILKEDLSSTIKRNNMVNNAKYYDGNYIISKGPENEIYDNVIAAQACDMLLEIQGVEASFVIYRRNENTVGISARSLGDINVQLIMERVGGGGHLSNAATQIKDVSIEEAYEMLIESLNH